MRPLLLKMNAFGPYPGLQILDFTQTNDDGLFLITGKTGAGKTSIFDAICIALYNKAASAKRDEKSFKSDYAKAEDVCYVELKFSVNDKIYSIKRTPCQLVLKRNGNIGEKEQDVALTLPDGEVITAINQVNDKIHEIIGLDSSQFKQIVMLPQGEFRKMLEANSKEKEVIFRKIFKTDIYKIATDKLKAMFDEENKKLSIIKSTLQINYSNLKTEDEELNILINEKFINSELVLSRFKEQTKKDEEQIKYLKSNRIDLNEKIKRLDVDTAKALFIDFESLEKYESNLIKLSSLKDEFSQKEKLIEKIKSAQSLSGDFAVLKEKETAIKKAEKDYKEEFAKKKELAANLEKVKTKFENAKNEYDNIDKLIQSQEKLKQQIVKNKEKLGKLNQITEALKKVELIVKSESNLQQKERSLKIREEYLNLIKKHNIFDEAKTKIIEFKKFKNEYLIKQDNYDRQMLAFYNAQAFILSQKLQSGVPCPVCGSENHPRPAKKPEKFLNESQLNLLKQQVEELNNQSKNAENTVVMSLSECDIKWNDENVDEILKLVENNKIELENMILSAKNEYLNAENFISSEDCLEDVVQQCEKINKEKITVLSQIDVLIDAIDDVNIKNISLDEQIKIILNKVDNINQNNKQAENDCLALKSRCDDVKGNYEKVNLVYNQTNSMAEANGQMLKKLEIIGKKAREEANAQREEFDEKWKKLSFKTFEDFCGFHEKIPLIKKLDNEIKEYQQNVVNNKNRIEILKEQLACKKKPDIEKIEQENSLIKNQLEENEKQLTKIQVRFESNKNTIQNIKKELKNQEKAENTTLRYQKLYEISNGDKGNNQRLSFERYILAVYFNDIINAANLRLDKMTNSQFSLKRKETVAKRNIGSGLDIEVYDAYTGTQRDSSTLSGGQSFVVSLSLALGLADVIQQSSGGIFIETMFIDEGFGSLDNEMLDRAIDTLYDLKKSGRLIGIISHVDMLKEKIEKKLVVESSVKGSVAYFTNN